MGATEILKKKKILQIYNGEFKFNPLKKNMCSNKF